MRFFVAGITGNIGGAVADKLLKDGHTVVALVRKPEKAEKWKALGVEIQQGDLQDREAVRSAMQNTDGAFLMIPPLITPEPDFPEARAVIDSYIKALEANRPGRVVALSSFGSQQTSGLGNITTTHLLEQALERIDLPMVFLRAGSLLENYLPGLNFAAQTGIFFTFLQPVERKVGMVATRDVGEAAARLLSSSWTGARIVEIGTYTSPADLAAAMSTVLHRNVEAQAIPRDRWTATLEQFGMPKASTWVVEQIFDGLNSGWIDFGQPNAERVTGSTSPADVFANTRRNSQ